MSEERTLDEALDEIDRWGDRVSQELESLSPEEVNAYFRRAQSELEQRLGRPLNLTVQKRPRKNAGEPRGLALKQATVEQFAQGVAGYLRTAQHGQVLITRDGRAVALVIGIENKDAEDFYYMTSPEFWQTIEETRRMPTMPLRHVKDELGIPEDSVSGGGIEEALKG